MRSFLLCSFTLLALVGCSLMSPRREPIALVPSIDLPRFMGDWYVIATIPLWPERKAYNPIETYTLQADGTIGVRYRMRKGGFDKPLKVYRPTGFVEPGTGNALWGMQFVWPFKGEYRIAFVESSPNGDYSATIIARSKRDYVWLMARTPTITETDYQRYVQRIAAMGYDVAQLRRVPQQWPEPVTKD
ncbi:lipocalin family protein [Hydrocarboniphaga effusa]|uniref:lipocalin family protein n=1 Tax=Hydrocarboniphaga effusa TaxID=243629 RepID=UPI00313822E7